MLCKANSDILCLSFVNDVLEQLSPALVNPNSQFQNSNFCSVLIREMMIGVFFLFSHFFFLTKNF